MLKRLARWSCVSGVAVGLLVTCGVVPAQAATAPRWRPVYLSRATYLESIAATGPRAAWAVGTTGASGTRPVLLVWNGSRWRSAKAPGGNGFALEDVQATAPDDVWVMGSTALGHQETYVWNGSSWQSVSLPDPLSATVLSSTDVWGLGEAQCSAQGACTSQVWRYQDGVVATYTLPGAALSMAGAGSRVWVLSQQAVRNPFEAGMTSVPAVYEGNAAGLHELPTPPGGRIGIYPQIAASPQGHVWALVAPARAGRPIHLDYWNGHRWSRRAVPRDLSYGSWGFIYDDRHGVWLGPYVHWTGRRWVVTNPSKPGPSYDLAYVTAIPGSASAWAISFADVHIGNHAYRGLIARLGRT
jgi:hypothetical protein